MDGLEDEFGRNLQVVRLNFADDANGRVIAALGVRGHPTIALLDREGEISRIWFGAATLEELRPLVAALVNR